MRKQQRRSASKRPRSLQRFRVGIVASRFNGQVTNGLVSGAQRALRQMGFSATQVDVVRVPGAFEIPVVLERLARSRRYGALVALGAVIQGETHHYDAICREVSRSVAETARTTGIPVGFGVIFANNLSEAKARSGTKWNLGTEAAKAAVETAHTLREKPCANAARRANTR